MTLTLKEGAYYRRRDGVRIGPMKRNGDSFSVGGHEEVYNINGRDPLFPDQKSWWDIVSESRTPKRPRKVAKRKIVVRYLMAEADGTTWIYYSLAKAKRAKREYYPDFSHGPIVQVELELPSPAPARKRVRK